MAPTPFPPRGCAANSKVISTGWGRTQTWFPPFPLRGCGVNSEVMLTIPTIGVGGQLRRDFHQFHHFHHGGWGPPQKWFPPFPQGGLGTNSDVISTISTMGVGDNSEVISIISTIYTKDDPNDDPLKSVFSQFPLIPSKNCYLKYVPKTSKICHKKARGRTDHFFNFSMENLLLSWP